MMKQATVLEEKRKRVLALVGRWRMHVRVARFSFVCD